MEYLIEPQHLQGGQLVQSQPSYLKTTTNTNIKLFEVRSSSILPTHRATFNNDIMVEMAGEPSFLN
jgi:hypothetical protein